MTSNTDRKDHARTSVAKVQDAATDTHANKARTPQHLHTCTTEAAFQHADNASHGWEDSRADVHGMHIVKPIGTPPQYMQHTVAKHEASAESAAAGKDLLHLQEQ